MADKFPLLGFLFSGGYHDDARILSDCDQVVTFLHANLYAEQVVITDRGDDLWFEAVNGVDLYSRLGELGIDLQAIFQQRRKELYGQDEVSDPDRNSWEELYDSIGLSAEEIAMRRRVKDMVKRAETIEDVIHLLEDSYFDAVFTLPDDPQSWGYFNPADCSVTFHQVEDQVNPENKAGKVILLKKTTRVRHVCSGEDIHHFDLIDLPSAIIRS